MKCRRVKVTWGDVRLLSYCSMQSDNCSEESALSRAGDPTVSGAGICRLFTMALSKWLWGRSTFLEFTNNALDLHVAAGMGAGFLACKASLSVSLCIQGLGMWPEHKVNLKQYKWACLSKALHPPRSSKCLGERMAAHRVPACLLPWLGTACFALLRGRAVNLGCVEAGEVSWEIFKDYIVAWEKELQKQSLLPYYTQGSLQGVFMYKSFWMKLVTPMPSLHTQPTGSVLWALFLQLDIECL